MNASQNTFVCKESTTPEEYLKDMISHVQEDGYLAVARDYEKDCYFVTSNNIEDADLIEEFKLDGELADYDSLYSYYQHVLKGIEDNSIWNELLLDATSNEYARRICIFAKRLKGLIDINASQTLTDNEKIMLIDSVLLCKTDAEEVGITTERDTKISFDELRDILAGRLPIIKFDEVQHHR